MFIFNKRTLNYWKKKPIDKNAIEQNIVYSQSDQCFQINHGEDKLWWNEAGIVLDVHAKME
jgi:hypothetical protein